MSQVARELESRVQTYDRSVTTRLSEARPFNAIAVPRLTFRLSPCGAAEKFEHSHHSSPAVGPFIGDAKIFHVEGHFLTRGTAVQELDRVSVLSSKIDCLVGNEDWASVGGLPCSKALAQRQKSNPIRGRVVSCTELLRKADLPDLKKRSVGPLREFLAHTWDRRGLGNPPDYEYLQGILPEADGSKDVWPGLRHRLRRSSQMPIRTLLASMSQRDTQAVILETSRDTIRVRIGLHEEHLRLTKTISERGGPGPPTVKASDDIFRPRSEAGGGDMKHALFTALGLGTIGIGSLPPL